MCVLQGMAFTLEERQALGIHGLLPPRFKTQEEQLELCKLSVERYSEDLNKYIYLTGLQVRAVLRHVCSGCGCSRGKSQLPSGWTQNNHYQPILQKYIIARATKLPAFIFSVFNLIIKPHLIPELITIYNLQEFYTRHGQILTRVLLSNYQKSVDYLCTHWLIDFVQHVCSARVVGCFLFEAIENLNYEGGKAAPVEQHVFVFWWLMLRSLEETLNYLTALHTLSHIRREICACAMLILGEINLVRLIIGLRV